MIEMSFGRILFEWNDDDRKEYVDRHRINSRVEISRLVRRIRRREGFCSRLDIWIHSCCCLNQLEIFSINWSNGTQVVLSRSSAWRNIITSTLSCEETLRGSLSFDTNTSNETQWQYWNTIEHGIVRGWRIDKESRRRLNEDRRPMGNAIDHRYLKELGGLGRWWKEAFPIWRSALD